MKQILISLLFLVNFNSFSQVHVKGYYRSNGTYVQPHERTAPNSTITDNYSYPGNYNPNKNAVTPIPNYNSSSNTSSFSTGKTGVEGYYKNNGTSSVQSEFTFDELLDIEIANSSDFETIVLNKGYQFDSVNKVYFYSDTNNDKNYNFSIITNRFELGDYYGFVYNTYSKENYLKIKNRMIEMKFKYLKNVPIGKTDLEGFLFNSNDIYITLYTETKDLMPLYNIFISVNLSEIK